MGMFKDIMDRLGGKPKKKQQSRSASTSRRRNPASVAIATPALRPGAAKDIRVPIRGKPKCCADLENLVVVCENKNDPRHGAVVTAVGPTNVVNGVAVTQVTFTKNGKTTSARLPMCEVPDDQSFKPRLPGPCCADLVNMIVVCEDANDPRNGAVIREVGPTNEMNGVAVVSITYETATGQGADRLPMCEVPDDQTFEPTPTPCCYDQAIGRLVCADATSPLNLAEVVLEAINMGPGGKPLATVYVNGDPSAGMRVPLCDRDFPDCCVDIATATLVCPNDSTGSFNGLSVSIEQVGQTLARVSHPALQPNGFAYFPLCKEPPSSECCFDQDTGTIVCTDPSNPMHGQTAGVITDPGPDASGLHWVEVAWQGGQGRMLLCGERPQCPPQYCCVNIDSGRFVCPGIPALNGAQADVVTIEDADGYRWATLADGQQAPVCGRECPPPQLCPDGLWRSPTGECTIPPSTEIPGSCPTCPPGMLLDTQTGQCVEIPAYPPGECPPCEMGQCPPCPPCPSCGDIPPILPPDCEDGCCPVERPFQEHCCESCATGGPCEDGCDGDEEHDHSQEGNPFGSCCESCATGGPCEGDCPSDGQVANPDYAPDVCPAGWGVLSNGSCHAKFRPYPWKIKPSHIWMWKRMTQSGKYWWTAVEKNLAIQKWPHLKAQLANLKCKKGANHQKVIAILPTGVVRAFCLYYASAHPHPDEPPTPLPVPRGR